MKLFTAVTFLSALAPALAELPEGFYEQCCIRQIGTLPPPTTGTPGFIRDRRELAKLDKLKGYSKERGVHRLCAQEADSSVTLRGGWVCYTYKEVCENNMIDGAPGPFAPVSPASTSEVCLNGQNCYNPNDSQVDENCVGDPDGFPDIWWSCHQSPLEGLANGKIIEYFHCGFECKFTDVCGDPHFQTFDEKWFDFHGECDLVLLKAEEFGMGLGLDIHIRTKGRYEYSFIESAAVKIGDDILEVSSYGAYAFNGVSGADLSSAKFADMYTIVHDVKDAQTTEYTIRTGGKEAIIIKSFKDLVSVRTTNATAYNFGSAEGMMGDFFEGNMLGRDGKTIINDADAFGLEWQVIESDAKLFQTPSPVTGKCIMPSERVTEGRRLGGTHINQEAAMTACAHVQGAKFDNCVYDVVATADLETAKSY